MIRDEVESGSYLSPISPKKLLALVAMVIGVPGRSCLVAKKKKPEGPRGILAADSRKKNLQVM